MSRALSVEVSAHKFVRRTQRPSFIRDWRTAAVLLFGARREKNGVCRFSDGSAVAFTSAGLPVEFIG